MFLRDSPSLCGWTRQYAEIMNDSDHKQTNTQKKKKKRDSTFYCACQKKKLIWCLAYVD